MKNGVISPRSRLAGSVSRVQALRALLPLLFPLACTSALAQTAPAAPRWQFQLSPSITPRFEPLQATPTVRAGVTGWAFNSPHSVLGLSFDVSTPQGTGLVPPLRGPAVTSVDLGLRWQTALSRSSRLDLAAWRRTHARAEPLGLTSDPIYGTNVEMQFDALNTFGFKPQQSAIGLQVNSGGASLKSNQSVLYYRARF
ncbi:MAG: hypothetical protein AB7I35_06055 [Ramlibacter sp.]